MQELFLNAAIQGDLRALGRLIVGREDVLHWRDENGATVADQYRAQRGSLADRRIAMLLAPPFEPEGFLADGFLAEGFLAEGFLAEGFLAEGFLAEGFLMPAWFFVPGAWDSIGINWS